MSSRLWFMNAEFEDELAHRVGAYRRPAFFDALNERLAPHLLWLARAGDALLIPERLAQTLESEAARREVELISLNNLEPQTHRVFTPWGWTQSAAASGEKVGAVVQSISFETVRRVNSKLWSHALEVELGVAEHGAATATTFEELREAVARACPLAGDKWVIKSPFGFAARERVLGRGPIIEEPQAKWSRGRLNKGEALLFEPWLEVTREYGVVMEILKDGATEIRGISDLQANGAGTGVGYLLGREPAAHRVRELESIAASVSKRLFAEGYHGPVGIDALEHARGLRPLLEINARYTMGFIALAIERSLKPQKPIFWSTK